METAILKSKQVRRMFIENQWWFSVIDVVEFFTDSGNPEEYWQKMKIKEKDEAGVDLSILCRYLKIKSTDGKLYEAECVNVEDLFRIIQSIPSPKAEAFKRWLVRIGKERIDEIENPDWGIRRVIEFYEKKGYTKAWIEERLCGIAVRQKLTDEWAARGAKEKTKQALLTDEIMQNTFGINVEGYKTLKGLQRENLRDYMTDLELILTMLGEAATTGITRVRDSHGLIELQRDAKDGGAIAGRTRRDIENKLGKKIASKESCLLQLTKGR